LWPSASGTNLGTPQNPLSFRKTTMSIFGTIMNKIFHHASAAPAEGCVFRRNQPPIPIEASHLFRSKPAGHSDGSQPG
jgi:hypothetical protein